MIHRRLAIIRRRVFTALSVLSLLLCAATLALWVRGQFVTDRLRYTTAGHHWLVQSFAGRVHIFRYRFEDSAVLENYRADRRYETVERQRMIPDPAAWEQFGFRYSRVVADWAMGGRASKGIVWLLSLPHWFLALFFAILPALYLRTLIRSCKRNHAGHCPRCGYDLRATPERCPECGTERALATDEHR